MIRANPIKIFHHDGVKIGVFFFSYLMLAGIFHVILISVVTFFHLWLEHRLPVIEDWVTDQGWKLLLASKVFAAYGVFKFISIRSSSRHLIKDIFTPKIVRPGPEIMALCFFILVAFIAPGLPVSNSNQIEYTGNILWSFSGTVFFYLVDLFIIVSLDKIYPLNRNNAFLGGILCLASMFILSDFTYYPGQEKTGIAFFHFLMIFLLSQLPLKNWENPAIYIFVCAAPLSSFFGQDLLWNDSYSPLIFSKPLQILQLTAVFALCLTYLVWKRRGIIDSK